MAKLYYARISKINYKKGMADIIIEEHENQVVNDVPFLAGYYEMPKVKERVAVLLEYTQGDIDKGVILGPIYSVEKEPNKNGKGIFEKRFKDGTNIVYDESSKTMEISAKCVKVKELNAGSVKTKELNADSAKISSLDAPCNCKE